MKRIMFRGLLFVLLFFCSAPAWAFTKGDQNYDFVIDGIYYHITSSSTVEVTFLYYDTETASSNLNKDAYSGDIVIPEVALDYPGTEHSNGGEPTLKGYYVTAIGDYAFYYCTGVTSVEIPNTVTSIGDEAFLWCNALKTVILGSSVSTIGYMAFMNCGVLSQIVSLNTTPPIFTNDMSPAFTGGTTTTRTLFVPYGSKSAYTEDTANSENSLNTWNPNVSSYKNIHKIKEFLEVEIKATVQDHYGYGCATFYSDNPFYTYYSYPLANPAQHNSDYWELECATASVSDGSLNLNWEYGENYSTEVVPGKTAVVIYGLTGTHYPVIYEDGDDASVAAVPENNMLLGSEEAITTYGPDETKDYKFYKFTYEGIEKSGVYTGLGFYWDQDNGAAFTSAAFKAWLAVPDNTADAKISSFVLGEDNTTGISSVDSSKPATDAIYNLQGIRVNDMSRPGIYIVGGKKVIKK